MAISQTVFINIVVRGGKVDLAGTATGIKSVNDEAGKVPKTTKAAGSGVDILKAKLTSLGSFMGNFFLRTINTLVKAIISMIGVMLVWTALITIPQMLAKGLFAIAKGAIAAADEVKNLQIRIAALMASVMSFGDTAEANFAGALEAARYVHAEMIKLSTKSLATAEELMLGYQAFLAANGQQLVSTLEEQYQLAEMLASAALTLTGRQMGAAKQIFTEIATALEGTLRPGAQLTRFIEAQVGDYQEWLRNMRENKSGLEDFKVVLRAIIDAGAEQANTITGITTAIQGYLKGLSLIATEAGVFKDITDLLGGIRDTLGEAIFELMTLEGGFGNLSKESQAVLNAMNNIGTAIQLVVNTLAIMTGLYKNASSSAEGLETITDAILQVTIKMLAAVVTVVDEFKKLWRLLQLISLVSGGGRNFILGVGKDLAENVDFLEQYAEKLKEINRLNMEAYFSAGKPTPEMPGYNEQVTESMRSSLRSLYNELAKLQAGEDELLKIEINRKQVAQQIMVTFAGTYDALQEALWVNERITEEEKKQYYIKQQKKALETINALAKEYEILIANGDKLAEIEIERYYRALKLKEELKGQNAEFLKAMGYLNEITKLERLRALIAEGYKIAKGNEDVAAFWDKIYQENIKKMDATMALQFKRAEDAYEKAKEMYDNLIGSIESYTDRAIVTTRLYTSELEYLLTQYAKHNATAEEVRQAIKNIQDQMIENANIIEWLKKLYEATGLQEILDLIRALTEANRRMNGSLQQTADLLSYANIAMERYIGAMERYVDKTASFVEVIGSLGRAAAYAIGQGMGSAFTQMFAAMKAGESAWDAFKKAVGTILIQMGELAVSLGTIALLAGLIPLFTPLSNPAAAVALIALGAGMIAAGVAMGGAGGGSRATQSAGGGEENKPIPAYVNNPDIAAQQGIQNAINANTVAVNVLNGELSRLSKENGDVLVTKTIKNNAKTVVQTLATTVGRSVTLQKQFGGAAIGTST